MKYYLEFFSKPFINELFMTLIKDMKVRKNMMNNKLIYKYFILLYYNELSKKIYKI